MLAAIEKAKAEALRLIRASRPRLQEDGRYRCGFCGASDDNRGWQMWHNCPERAAQGIELRRVRS